jgi:hypothetical protein
MVHALERARKHLVPGGAVVLIQPRRLKRPSITITFRGGRRPVAVLINPASEPLIAAAEAAIQKVVDGGLFVPLGKRNHSYSARLANPAQLDRYLYAGQRPPRFPPGGRRRLRSLWAAREPGAQIEVTEYMAVIALRTGRPMKPGT